LTEGQAMLKDFYIAFATISFTLLGLWFIVVQTRHAEWRGSAVHRRRAYAVSLHFALPGVMSLLSLVDPSSKPLWRASFAVVALGGILILVAVRGPAPGPVGVAAYAAAMVGYALIAVIALAPTIVGDLGIDLSAARVEAILLTFEVFLGANVAWLLLFDDVS
jgi:hypothetical protein